MHGLKCYDGFTGELLWEEYETGTLAPVPSVAGQAWAVTLQHRGLLFGSNIRNTETIIDMRYPSENWCHGIPLAVAANGAVISICASSLAEYQNSNLRKNIYSNSDGYIIWISSEYSVSSSPLKIHTVNNNYEAELTGGTNSIQSNGERFIYSDYNQIRILRLEEGDE